jgi:Sulfotransferase family
MEDKINRPIFVIGSPRSGTSVLTVCLGRHPNIIALEESGWMGDLAIDLAIHYETGTARGDYSLLSSMDVTKAEFFYVFGQSINDLILRHRVDLNRRRWQHAAGPNAVMGPKTKSQLMSDPKARWVDATPEYSMHVCGLRKLFPQALFIHIFRDVTSVVRSMLHFHHVSGQSLVTNVQEAYSYWLRTVNNCLLAERAYGPNVVFRIRHSDLADASEATLRSIFGFLGEPFAPECLEPLTQRINSSNVPADFQIDDRGTDPSLVEQALQLSREVEVSSQPLEASVVAIEEIERAFDERVRFVANLPNEFRRAQDSILTQQTRIERISARAARLATEVKKKSAAIEHRHASRKYSNWLGYVFRALPKTFQRRQKNKETHPNQIDDPAVSVTNTNQPADIDWRI